MLHCMIKQFIVIATAALVLGGCSGPVDAGKLKAQQQKRAKVGASSVQEQTGVDLGTAAPAPKGGLNRLKAPVIDP